MREALLSSSPARRRQQGLVFSFNAGNGLNADGTFTRATTAAYVASVPDEVFDYAAGDSLATATFTRASTAVYTAEV